MPNPISKKLLLSKWTACKPKIHDSALLAANTIPVGYVELEAIMSKRCYLVSIEDLKNQDQWRIGWQN
jgi:hypothetical protein